MPNQPTKQSSAGRDLNDGNNNRASWNISGDTVTRNTIHYSARARKALRGLFQIATTPGHEVHVTDACRRIGVSKNLLFDKLLKYNYRDPKTGEKRGPSLELVKHVERYIIDRQKEIDLTQSRHAIGRIPFIETPTSKRIWRSCELALDYQIVVIIKGRSHIGKTTPLRRFCMVKNHGYSTYVECESSAGVQGLCKLFCKARRISDKGSFDRLKDRVFNSIGEGDFVAIDEMGKLLTTYQLGSRLRALEFIRDIYDKRRVGMVWCVTDLFKREIQQGQLSVFLEQFNRRAPIEIDLGDTPLVGDVRAFFQAYGLEFPKAFRGETWELLKKKYKDPVFSVAHDIAHYYGIKRLEVTILAARRRAEERNEAFGWNHFLQVHQAFELLRQKPKA